MVITDNIFFKMPTDPELQTAMVAVWQTYVNQYLERSRANDVAGVLCATCKLQRSTPDKCQKCGDTSTVPIATYQLCCGHDMSQEDWQIYLRAGLMLTYAPMEVVHIDSVIDLNNDRLNSFKTSGKHVCQIGSMLAGIAVSPLPALEQRKPNLTKDFLWASLGPIEDNIPWVSTNLGLEELLAVPNGLYTGFVGRASRETYLACAMGFPVVEIIPTQRSRNWLSKWTNTGYRVVDGAQDEKSLAKCVRNAMNSIEQTVSSREKINA